MRFVRALSLLARATSQRLRRCKRGSALLLKSFDDRGISIDRFVSDAWGRMSAMRHIPVIDGLLAATAKVHGLTLVGLSHPDCRLIPILIDAQQIRCHLVFLQSVMMLDEKFDLCPLDLAIDRLNEGLLRYQQDTSDIQIRDGLIQRFEFTYEISHKMLKRHLEAISPNPSLLDEMSFQDLIRSANEQGLLSGSWVDWKRYREMRSKTSHSYDEIIALEVVACIPTFLAEASYLRDQIRARLA